MSRSAHRLSDSGRPGFSLVDLAVLISIVVVGGAIAAPTLNGAWRDRLARLSANNLHVQGIGTSMYASDNADRIPTYTWRGPVGTEPYVWYLLPDGNFKRATSDQEAAALQNQAILMEMTGRLKGPYKILGFSARIPHRRFVHLVLQAYLGAKTSGEMFVDPMDTNLLTWHRDELNYNAGSTVPYAPGEIIQSGYEEDGYWASKNMRQRWAFASSYATVPTAWLAQGDQVQYAPIEDSMNLFMSTASGTPLPQGNTLGSVVFPANKVYIHEEYDRRNPLSNGRATVIPHYAYDAARPLKLMFDGSINDRPSGEGSSSYHPVKDTPWTQKYTPLHTFPLPFYGLGDPTPLDLRYRWTRGGLSGVDYTP
ncbi:MAG: hypothetical protein KC996_04895 [Phycisphaerales bacterium]|nr:hypothetical protein [Phycisphaerales bacterium]